MYIHISIRLTPIFQLKYSPPLDPFQLLFLLLALLVVVSVALRAIRDIATVSMAYETIYKSD